MQTPEALISVESPQTHVDSGDEVGLTSPVAGSIFLDSCGRSYRLSFSVNTKIHRHYYLEMKYLACVFCLAFRHLCDISVVIRVNNISHQEGGVAQPLVKSCYRPDKHKPFLTVFWMVL